MMLLHELVTYAARSAPDSPAVISREGIWSYQQLHETANRIARALEQADIQHGDRVILQANRSPRVIAAMIGVLRAGGVYVPLDPQSPPQRLSRTVADCNPRFAAIDGQVLSVWRSDQTEHSIEQFLLLSEGPGDAADTVPWTHVQDLPATGSAGTSEAGPDDLAYILYTSGSTGTPKGVMLSHRNALAFVTWAANLLELNSTDRLANHAPLHFDLSVFDIYAGFLSRAAVCLLDESINDSPSQIIDKIHDWQITIWYSVPSALMMMMDRGNLLERGMGNVRAVLFAGEVFPLDDLRRLMRAVPEPRYFNFFGPTETNVCLHHEVDTVPPAGPDAIPIGRQASGNDIFILNSDGRPVPDGETGEIHVSGPTVMLGYWDNQPAAAPPDPYPTGDLGSRRSDGAVMYHGRRDHMVQIRGRRIELGEIESALHEHENIRRAVTFVDDDTIVAVVTSRGADPSVFGIRKHCAGLLPPYMIPDDIRKVEKIPLTSTGKPDRVEIRRQIESSSLALTS